jgi:hypothetical protein
LNGVEMMENIAYWEWGREKDEGGEERNASQ